MLKLRYYNIDYYVSYIPSTVNIETPVDYIQKTLIFCSKNFIWYFT